ncbi:MAG: hypothetical protein SFY95_03245 [Planctomycetota bacterium]|nr:hypothetical protein [Planctomycetota bacterium]
MRPTLAILSLLSAASLIGCSAPKTQGTFDVPAGSYAQAFDATRDVLRSYRFTLERTDAQQGVITTAPKTTQGLASPWDAEQSSVGQEWEDFVNQQRRRVRVTFEPAVESAGQPAGDSTANPQAVNSGAVNSGGESDLKPLVGKVEVIVERVQRPGWRPATRSIRSSSFAYDEDFGTRGLWPTYTVVQSGDPDLADRLADRLAEQIRRRLAPR